MAIQLTKVQQQRFARALKRTQQRYGKIAQPQQKSSLGFKRLPQHARSTEPTMEYAPPSMWDRTAGEAPTLAINVAKGFVSLFKEPGEALGAGVAALLDPEAKKDFDKEAGDVKDLVTGALKSMVGTAGRIPLPAPPIPGKTVTNKTTGETRPSLSPLTTRGVLEMYLGPEKGPKELFRVSSEESQRYYDNPLDATVEDLANATIVLSAGAGVLGKVATVAEKGAATAEAAGSVSKAATLSDVAAKAQKASGYMHNARIGNVLLNTPIGKGIAKTLEQKALNLHFGQAKTLGETINASPHLTSWKQHAEQWGLTSTGRAKRKVAIDAQTARLEAFHTNLRSEADAIQAVKRVGKAKGVKLKTNEEMLQFLDKNPEHPMFSDLGIRVPTLHARLWAESNGLARTSVEFNVMLQAELDDWAMQTNNPMMHILPSDDITKLEEALILMPDPMRENFDIILEKQKQVASLDQDKLDMRYADLETLRRREADLSANIDRANILTDNKLQVNRWRKARKKTRERAKKIEQEIAATPAAPDKAELSSEYGRKVNDLRDTYRSRTLAVEQDVKLREGLISTRQATHDLPGEYVYADEEAAKTVKDAHAEYAKELKDTGLDSYVNVDPRKHAKLVEKHINEVVAATPELGVKFTEDYVNSQIKQVTPRDRPFVKQKKQLKDKKSEKVAQLEELKVQRTPGETISETLASGTGWEVRLAKSELGIQGTKTAFFGRPKVGQEFALGKGSELEGSWKVKAVNKDNVVIVEQVELGGLGKVHTIRRYNKKDIKTHATIPAKAKISEAKFRTQQSKLNNEIGFLDEKIRKLDADRAKTKQQFEENADFLKEQFTQEAEQALREKLTEGSNKFVQEKIQEAQALGTRLDEKLRPVYDDPNSYAPPERVRMRVGRAMKNIRDHMDGLGLSEETLKAFRTADITATLDDLNAAGVRLEFIHSAVIDFNELFSSKLFPSFTGERAKLGSDISQRKQSTYKRKTGTVKDPSRDAIIRINNDDLDTARTVIDRRVLVELENKWGLTEEEALAKLSPAARAEMKDLSPQHQEEFMRRWGYEAWDPSQLTGVARHPVGREGVLWMPTNVRKIIHQQFKWDPFKGNIVVQQFDKAQGAWKTSVLALSPRWHVNNIFGGVFLSWAMGEVPMSRMPGLFLDTIRTYRNAGVITKDTARSTEKLLRKDSAGKIGVEDLPEVLGYDAYSKASSPIPEELSNSGVNIATTGGNVLHRAVRGSYKFNGFIDSMVRQSVYLNHVIKKIDTHPEVIALRTTKAAIEERLAQTPKSESAALAEMHTTLQEIDSQIMDLTEPIINRAVELGNDTLGHFKKLNHTERYIARRAYPFYVWTRHMASTALRMLRPQNINRTLALAWIAEIFGQPTEEERRLPTWASSLVNMDFTVNGEPVFLNVRSIMPYSDITKPFMAEGRFSMEGALQSTSPLLRRPLELFAGVRFPGPQLLPSKKEITPGGKVVDVGPGVLDMLKQDIGPLALADKLIRGNEPVFATGDPITYQGVKPQPMAFALSSYMGVPLRTLDPGVASMKNYRNQLKALRQNVNFQRKVLQVQGKSPQEISKQLSARPPLPRRLFYPSLK